MSKTFLLHRPTGGSNASSALLIITLDVLLVTLCIPVFSAAAVYGDLFMSYAMEFVGFELVVFLFF